ncbi:MAG: hypothetical protein ACK4H7_02800 [Acidilobaceae archaeon]
MRASVESPLGASAYSLIYAGPINSQKTIEVRGLHLVCGATIGFKV